MRDELEAVLSLEALRFFVDRSPEPVGIHERGVLLHGNERLARMLRVPSLELLVGRPLSDFVLPEQREPMARRVRTHEQVDELATSFETRVLCSDGTVLDVETVSTRLDLGGRAVVVSSIRDISARKRAEATLCDQAAVFEIAQRVATFGIWTEDLSTGARPAWSAQAYRIVGIDPAREDDAYQLLRARVHPDDHPGVVEARRRMVEQHEPFDHIYRVVQAGGTIRWIHGQGDIVHAPDGSRRVIGVMRDVTERRALEEQLARSQKMEAIGRLAGGIAHDFNNLLMVMMGQVGIARRRLMQPELVAESLSELEHAVERAASLTQQLLAFARRQVLQQQTIDLALVLREVESLIRRIIGEDVLLDLRIESDRAWVRADRSQLEQVVFNLVVNARDAMPHGGRLTIRLRDDTCEDAPPGTGHVLLEVADQGCGVPLEIRDRIFEPFFTTKEPGQGSGLGLSTVYAIVEQAGGRVELDTEPGRGSTFRIRWPSVPAPRLPSPVPTPLESPEATSRGTVVLVEDDEPVRTVLSMGLTDLGYSVHAAENGERALALLAGPARGARAVVTDVVMPGTSGPELARKAWEIAPNLEVVLLSGYAADHVDRALLMHPRVRFMQKPIAVESLSVVLDEIVRG